MYTLVIMGFQNHLPNLWYLRTRSGITCISCFKEDSEKLRCSGYLIKQQPFDIKFLLAILRRHSTHIAFNIKLHDNCWLQLRSFCLWKPGDNQLEKQKGLGRQNGPLFSFLLIFQFCKLNLLVATTLLMKSAILMMPNVVVLSSLLQASLI